MISQKEFAEAVLDNKKETFVVYVTFFISSNKRLEISIYLSCRVQLVLLIANVSPIAIPFEYSNYADILLFEFVVKRPKHTKINDHLIGLGDDYELLYGLIYNLEPVE